MSEFIRFISSQIIIETFDWKVKKGKIEISMNGRSYSEPFFDTEASFSNEDIGYLKTVSHKILNNESIDSIPPKPSILKNWYLLTHEKYFQTSIQLDRYGRIGQANLRDEFLEILKVPIADILKILLQKHLGIETKKTPKIYLTCDFDILNVWDVWTIKDLAREILHCSKKLQFRKLYETVASFLLSRKVKSFNGYLNELMYDFDSCFINIGFFIASPENRKYDGKIDYKNGLVQSYIKTLKQKGVIFGLHTNFDTKDNPNSILKQQEDFNILFQEKTNLNRHHYLRFHFPDYLETLEMGNIEKDFSLYFPESMLFRAGTCSEYCAWNEKESRPYRIKLIPTTIMDGTFSDYLHCSYDEALTLSINKINLTLKYCDSVVLLWHNRSTYQYANIVNNYHPQLITKLIDYLKTRY